MHDHQTVHQVRRLLINRPLRRRNDLVTARGRCDANFDRQFIRATTESIDGLTECFN